MRKKDSKRAHKVDNILPVDLEAEKALIGCCLGDAEAIPIARQIVTAQDFDGGMHRRIFAAIEALADDGKQVNTVSVVGQLKDIDAEQAVDDGEIEYLDRAARDWGPAGSINVRELAERARDKAHLRELIKATAEVQRKAYANPEDIPGLFAEAQDSIGTLAARVTADQGAPFCTASEASVFMQGITWLWEPWIPNGYLTVLAGDAGVGKSAFALRLSKSVSEPCEWPDGADGPDRPGNVVFCDTEAAQALLIDRVEKWGLPEERILLPGPDGMGHLWMDEPQSRVFVRQRVEEQKVSLVIIDSFRSGFRGDENASDVAELMGEWAALARDLSVPIVLVHHLRKRQPGEKRDVGLEHLRGSSAIGAAVRSVILLERPDPQSETIRVKVEKLNLAPKPEPIGFEISGTGGETVEAPDAPRRATVLTAAEDFLQAKLKHGGRPVGELIAEAEADGISEATLRRAARSLEVVSLPDPERPPQGKLWGLAAPEG